MKSIEEIKVFPDKMQTMEDFQKFHRWLDERKHFDEDILFNMVLLSGEVGEVAQVIKQVRKKAHQLQEKQGPAAALDTALAEYRDDL